MGISIEKAMEKFLAFAETEHGMEWMVRIGGVLSLLLLLFVLALMVPAMLAKPI